MDNDPTTDFIDIEANVAGDTFTRYLNRIIKNNGDVVISFPKGLTKWVELKHISDNKSTIYRLEDKVCDRPTPIRTRECGFIIPYTTLKYIQNNLIPVDTSLTRIGVQDVKENTASLIFSCESKNTFCKNAVGIFIEDVKMHSLPSPHLHPGLEFILPPVFHKIIANIKSRVSLSFHTRSTLPCLVLTYVQHNMEVQIVLVYQRIIPRPIV